MSSKKATRERGRPSKFASAHRQIIRGLESGLSIERACHIALVDKTAYYEWLRRDDAGEAEFAGFAAECRRAKAGFVAKMTDVVKKAASRGDWRAALALLSARVPEEYGKRSEPEDSPGETRT